jgi:hypothetical protein
MARHHRPLRQPGPGRITSAAASFGGREALVSCRGGRSARPIRGVLAAAGRRVPATIGATTHLFIRVADRPFDDNHRLLAYIAPNYSAKERATLPREQRSTFNLDLVAAGWAAPFIIYPSIPGEPDLPLFLAAGEKAMKEQRGIWRSATTLLAYEYRAMEKLHRITKKKVEGHDFGAGEEFSWRERYCVDMRNRVLHGPEDYFHVDPIYRLWLWPQELPAISRACWR